MRLANSVLLFFFLFRVPALEVPVGNSKRQFDFNMNSSGDKSNPPKGNDFIKLLVCFIAV